MDEMGNSVTVRIQQMASESMSKIFGAKDFEGGFIERSDHEA